MKRTQLLTVWGVSCLVVWLFALDCTPIPPYNITKPYTTHPQKLNH